MAVVVALGVATPVVDKASKSGWSEESWRGMGDGRSVEDEMEQQLRGRGTSILKLKCRTEDGEAAQSFMRVS